MDVEKTVTDHIAEENLILHHLGTSYLLLLQF